MLTFLGDVFPREPVAVDLEFEGTVVFNLEAPLTLHAVGYPGKINLRGNKAILAAMFPRRPLAVSLANNHIMDFYDAGLDDTFAALDELGIMHFGAGDASNGWRNPLMIESGGMRVAMLGYAHPSCTPVFASETHAGAAELTLERVREDVAAARQGGAQRVVVQAHWGEEHVSLPTRSCIELGRAMVDAGVDLVIGHHAHCIQAYETYAGKPIFYGLGNCIFPAHRSPSYYDTSGRPTKTATTEPALRNRRSLAVSWDPATQDARITPLVFQAGRLRQASFSHRRYRLKVGAWEEYEVRYARAFNYGKLLHTLERFVGAPKLPRLHHVKSIVRLLRSSPPS